MDQNFKLKYAGRAVDRGEMDAYELAEAIRGFSDLTHLISRTLYGDEVVITTKVRGVGTGSVTINFLYHLLQSEAAGMIFSALGSPGDLLKVLKDCIGLLKHLHGTPPKSITRKADGEVIVENNNGVINHYSSVSYNIIVDPTAGRAARACFGRPLERSAETVEIIANDEVLESASEEDADSFVPVETSDTLAQHVSQVHLTIHTAVFHGKTRWRFSDGRTKFTARIEDQEFLDRVEAGTETFRRGDELVVRLRSIQKRVNRKLQAEYVVEKVLEHKRPGRQRRFF